MSSVADELAEAATTRRRLLLWLVALAGTHVVPALGSEPDSIAPQPYFACSKSGTRGTGSGLRGSRPPPIQ